ncbi:FAD/NAD(P)-binding domain-containing protein [Mollisia scopiformis]|uniref:FAD/NAD(P)-binding domain-containing protein n=1 Tax=Mollisia scopiformis TaxID=149040 RepID=A0A194X7K9_MOLSC|nr:FAD/NAD(P)-binding domain-containing protein [Mollisia scopiformis]KUJ16155.1 FAD/NAD(P)-binding domain-containing protein [Mollisia scopiformis]
MQEQAVNIVVVGGSLAGLLHAIIFKHLGHKVHVLEKSSQSTLQSQAAGLGAGPEVRKLIDEYIKTDKPYATTSSLLEIVNSQGDIINSIPTGEVIYLTTWSLLYNMLKAHLLGDRTTPPATYETEKTVRDVNYDGNKVTVTYSDTNTGISNVLQADLVIAADGAHSSVRATVLPDVHPKYAGYVTWRGAVPEASVSEASREVLENRVIIFRTEKGYTISYHVPSESGSIAAGEHQFIWIWYEMLEENSEEFRETFTDITGVTRLTTVPRGKMNPTVWVKRQASGATLSAPFAELLSKTSDPFVSAIRDFVSPKAVIYDGKLLLVGDAFALFRPHLGASTNQAAKQADGLVDVFMGKGNLAEWEKASVEYATRTSATSNALGEYCFTGNVPGRLSTAIQPDKKSP